MSSKDELTSERRAQILRAAAVVFAQSGVDGARMDDIAAESGLSKGSLYWYFESKQEIAIALVDKVVGAQYQHLRSLLESPGSVIERLETFLDSYAGMMSAEPILGRLGIEFYAMSGRVPLIREFITYHYDEYIAVMTELLLQGQDRGELTVERPRELALNLACLIEGLTLLWAVDPDRIDLTQQFRLALATFLRGLSHRD